ncbi:DUF1996 domain-containing protein [Actinomarinicola tropica]|nr:DUF1996 domain-containing protein [Actinomarinicola tropica]
METRSTRRAAVTGAAVLGVLAAVALVVLAVAPGSDRSDRRGLAGLVTGSSGTSAPPGPSADGGPPPTATAEAIRVEGEVPESSAAEPSGNFRTICVASHLAYDDPIVNPGEPGASHLHMFFGNTETDASSTYESLRAAGGSTCQGGILNRTGYWAPAVLDAEGQVVLPEFVSVYYKGTGTAAEVRSVDELPPGLRMIAGYDAATGEGDHFDWYCEVTQDKGPTIPSCPEDELVGVVLPFPPCWDGVNLDSPDHRRHVAQKVRDPHTGTEACPDSHPVHLPELTIGIWYPHEGDSADWHLSSDRPPGEPAYPDGSTFHSDWFGAWDPEVQETWTERCIVGLLNCVGGELGDGTQLGGPEVGLPAGRVPAPPPP